MPSYSGVWTLPAQYQARGSTNWPMGPGAPTSVTATAGEASATVTFVAPTFTGIPPGITGYLATSSPGGITATGASSPLSVTGLTNGTAYTPLVDEPQPASVYRPTVKLPKLVAFPVDAMVT